MRTAKLRLILDTQLLDSDGAVERKRSGTGERADHTTGEWSIDDLSDRAAAQDR